VLTACAAFTTTPAGRWFSGQVTILLPRYFHQTLTKRQAAKTAANAMMTIQIQTGIRTSEIQKSTAKASLYVYSLKGIYSDGFLGLVEFRRKVGGLPLAEAERGRWRGRLTNREAANLGHITPVRGRRSRGVYRVRFGAAEDRLD